VALKDIRNEAEMDEFPTSHDRAPQRHEARHPELLAMPHQVVIEEELGGEAVESGGFGMYRHHPMAVSTPDATETPGLEDRVRHSSLEEAHPVREERPTPPQTQRPEILSEGGLHDMAAFSPSVRPGQGRGFLQEVGDRSNGSHQVEAGPWLDSSPARFQWVTSVARP
jgi:hypothetical protein